MSNETALNAPKRHLSSFKFDSNLSKFYSRPSVQKYQGNIRFLDTSETAKKYNSKEVEDIPSQKKYDYKIVQGGFQLLDLIITELKIHMTFYNLSPLIGRNYSILTGEQIV